MVASLTWIRSNQGLVGSRKGQFSKGKHPKQGENQNQAKGGGWEMRISLIERGGLWLQAWGCNGAQEGAQGFPIARGEGPLKLKQGDGEGGFVCVCEELYPSSFHESFEELHSQRVIISIFLHQELFL